MIYINTINKNICIKLLKFVKKYSYEKTFFNFNDKFRAY